MKTLLHPSYFPTISHFVIIAQDDVVWEAHDNYQKQTYRNRMYIYGANGKQLLSVPVKHLGKVGHQQYREVIIDNSFNWQKQHWKTLQTAYRTSPFFEFYEDDIAPLFHNEFNLLMDLNIRAINLICELIDLPFPDEFTKEYSSALSLGVDGRELINAKNKTFMPFTDYFQVFNERHGFLSNLSILDLLFNLGPETGEYLARQKKPLS